MKHWAQKYRGAASTTLEGKIRIAACYLTNSAEQEDRCRRIGQLAFDNDWPIWHAAWVDGGREGKCRCCQCARERGEG